MNLLNLLFNPLKLMSMFTLNFGGGGGGGGQTTSTGTTYQTNVPEYARPYVETMLGATQKQLFDTTQTDSGTEITGFKPYVPYSTNPQDYIAGFSPMQQQAQQSAANLQTPGAYGAAQGMVGSAGLGQLGTTRQAGMLGRQGMGIGQMGMYGAMPAFTAGQQYAQQVTNPGAVSQYMSPYMQDVVDVQKAAAVREAQIADQAARLGSARQGTYGGARQALQQSERERNLLSNLSNIQAQGSQQAYNQALQNMQYGANLGLQGISTGLQGIQAGQQGVAQGLAGVGAQQAGYSGAGQAASTLGSLAGQEFGAQQNIINLQNQIGAQQQAQQQAIINQAVQDYATQQQYPLMQLGFMSNMLRGLPMQATTTQSYMPTANPITSTIGALGAAGSLAGVFGKKEGGEVKSYAKGGIASYDIGGKIESDLYKLSPDDLEEIAKNTTSDSIRDMATKIAKRKELGLAGGGIVAFATGKKVYGTEDTVDTSPEAEEVRKAYIDAAIEKAKADKKEDSGIASIMFSDMQKPTRQVPFIEKPADFVAPTSAKVEQPQKGIPIWRRLLGESSGKAPTYNIPSAGRYEEDETPSSEKPSIVKTSYKSDASGRNEKGETPEEQKAMANKESKPQASEKQGEKESPPSEKQKTSVQTQDRGIISAAPSGSRIPGVSPAMQYFYEQAKGEKEKSVEDYMREITDARAKTLGPNVALQEERKRAMEERANLQDEFQRRKDMRLAQFFASWGSTPGSTLVAGMEALKKSVPGFISDDEDRRKAMSEVNKVISQLNMAERKEAEGDFDAAFKLKKDAANKASDLNKAMLQYQSHKEVAMESRSRSDEINVRRDELKAQAQRNAAITGLGKLRKDNATLYEQAEMPDSQAKTDKLKAARDSARKRVEELEREQRRAIEDADATLQAIRESRGGTGAKREDKKEKEAEPGTAANPIKIQEQLLTQ